MSAPSDARDLADHERTAAPHGTTSAGPATVTDPGGNPGGGGLHVRRVRRVGADGRDGDELGELVAERVGGGGTARESSQASSTGYAASGVEAVGEVERDAEVARPEGVAATSALRALPPTCSSAWTAKRRARSSHRSSPVRANAARNA